MEYLEPSDPDGLEDLITDGGTVQGGNSCGYCDSHVSQNFYRVFSDPDVGGILACPSCSSNAGIEEVHRERKQDR